MKLLVPICVTFAIILNLTQCHEYWISVSNGLDSNPGTQDKPWQHVSKALPVLKPGDTCTLRGGTYYEEIVINGLIGTQDKPIVFRAYPGESVVFDGTGGPINTTWSKYKGDNVYQAKIEEDIWQLFVDDELQINARWPNAFWYDYSVFDYTRWGFSDTNSTYNFKGGIGVMSDNGTHGLASSGINATGAMAVLNIGSWKTFTGYVYDHKPYEPNFSYHLDGPAGNIKFVPQNCRYFLEDKLEFLDAPTEWYYDKSTKTIFVWLKSSDSPENHVIKGKKSTYAFVIDDGSMWIKLYNLSFFATTVHIGTEHVKPVDGIELNSCHFTYPSYSKRMLGSLDVPNTTNVYYNGDLVEDAGHFIIFNCTWEYSDGQVFNYRGRNGLIQNNLWHHNDFSCVGDGSVLDSKGICDQFIRNVIHSNGPSMGYAPGSEPSRETDLTVGNTVRLNLLYDLKFLQDDGAHIQAHVTAQNSTIIENNWCFDTMKYGIRFDRINEDTAPWGYNGTISSNVVWNTGGVMVKGDLHHVLNNLIFDSTDLYDMHLFGPPGSGAKRENNHTVIANNIIQNGACSSAKATPCPGNPGNFTNNAQYQKVRDHLRDPDNFDFRPIKNSDYLSKGIGPYGKESVEHGGVYWIPGRLLLSASTPIPPNGTATAKCDAHLMWLEGYDALSHDVYFGKKIESVENATKSDPEYIGSFKVPSNIADPGPLTSGEQYYWRVDAVQANLISKGMIWEFSCK